MIRIIINNITRYRSKVLSNTCIYHYLDDNKSMISNIYACRSFPLFLQYYNQIKPYVIPRTLSIMSRRLCSLAHKNSIYSLEQKQMKILKQLIKDIIQIDFTMLTPIQCNNLLYFFRIFDSNGNYFEIEREKIKKLQSLLIQQIMINIQCLSCNNLIDFLYQMEERAEIYNKNLGISQTQNEGTKNQQIESIEIKNIQNRKIIINKIQEKFPKLEVQVVDSLFHLTKLLTNLILQQQQIKIHIGSLFKKLTSIIIQFRNYLPKSMIMDAINSILGNYSSMRKDNNFSSQIQSILINLLDALASKMEKQQEKQYKNSSMVIRQLIKQIQDQKEGQVDTIMKICLQICNLKKIYYRESDLQQLDKANYIMLQFRQFRKNDKRQPLYRHKDFH